MSMCMVLISEDGKISILNPLLARDDEKVPETSGDGTVLFHRVAIVDVRAEVISEAVDEISGDIIASGTSFCVPVAEGRKVTFRAVKCEKEFSQEEIDAARQETAVSICKQIGDDGPVILGGWGPGSLQGLINSLLDVQECIPAEYRKTAQCEFDIEYEYESAYTSVSIAYHRPETDDETRRRLEQAYIARSLKEREERAEFDRLSKKFEGAS